MSKVLTKHIYYLLAIALLIISNGRTSSPAHAEILPPCPAPISVSEFNDNPVPWVSVLLDGAGSAFNRRVVKGLGRTPPCANMSYIPPVPFGVVPTSAERGVNAIVSPSTIQLTDSFTDVTFDIVGLGVSAPFHASFPECFPLSSNGTCTKGPTNPTVAVRTENPDGSFSGPWSVIWSWKESPVQFDRIGNCISTAPVGSEQQPSIGPPCNYRVTFLRNPNAGNSFSLQRRTQLIVHTTWQGGITLSSDGRLTDNKGTDYTIFSMLLTPDAVQGEPEVESVNPQIKQIIIAMQRSLRKVQQSFPSSRRAAQNTITAELKTKVNDLVELVKKNPDKIKTANSKVNVTKLSNVARSAVLAVLKRKSRTFTSDRKKATDAIKALQKSLA